MKRKLININIIYWLLIGLQLLLALFALHDVATAQGVGLFLALQKGSPDRLSYDILVDVIGMISLILVLVIPYLLLRHRRAESLLRLVIAYFAFMPILSIATLVHLFDGHNLFLVAFDWENNVNLLSGLVRDAAPVLILLGALYKKRGFRVKQWHWIAFIIQGILGLGMCLLPELSVLLLSMMYYLLVIIAYDWWENLYAVEKNVALKIIFWLVFVHLLGRGGFKMLDLTSHYRL